LILFVVEAVEFELVGAAVGVGVAVVAVAVSLEFESVVL